MDIEPSDFHTIQELSAEQCNNFWTLLNDDFPELLRPVNSPHVRGKRDNPKEATCPMKPRRLKRFSPTKRAKLNRRLKDAVEDGFVRPNHSEFCSPILFMPIPNGSFRLYMHQLPWHERGFA
jgi:hypothetical protein